MESLRRWWDPNQEILVKVAPRVRRRTRKGGRRGGALTLCDASSGDLNGAQVRREESRGGRSQRGRGESPVRGGRGEPWLDRDADNRPARQGAQGRGLSACGQEHARAQGCC